MENKGMVELYQPRHTLIGRDGIMKIPYFLGRMNANRVLVVTDKGLIKSGTAGKITAVMDDAKINYVVYDGVEPNPSVRIVNEAFEFYKKNDCNVIIAVGGGSPIDVAKAVSILSANGGKIQDYNGYNKSKKRGTPIIAVNTTAGTGSECTRAYVVTDEESKSKMLMVDTNCLAHIALNDPMLMVGMPPSLTAATGIDALTHAIEAYICNTHTPFTDALAMESIRLVSESLREAVRDGSNMDARTDMCWAEYMAGLSFSNAGLGLVHGIAHQLGGYYNIPHGLANAIMLPRVLEFNRPYCMGRLAEVAQAMGEKVDHMSVDEASKQCIIAVRRLIEDVKIPPLCDTKFDMKDIDVIAEHALQDTATATNAVRPTREDVKTIIAKTYYEGLLMKKVKTDG
ncbi:MAG: iron-containing alcohol dehydrogenase [Ruminococcaceae bacterium]|nr:iron-containing alcohol dehydrogenase [Oscillospiraceae bacterium]